MKHWLDWILNPVSIAVAFFGASLFLMLASGAPLIAWLKGLKGMKWSPREDTPDSHLQKAGVPSMGGIGIIGSALAGYFAVFIFIVLLSTIMSGRNPMIPWSQLLPFLLPPAVVGGHALLGFVDDWSKARGRGGLLARQKLVGQIVLATAFVWAFAWFARYAYMPGNATTGFLNGFACFGLWLVIIGTSNAVNLTDGIDGLAAGLSIQCAIVFAFWTFNQRAGSLPIAAGLFWISLGGANLGFLAFNKHPAKVFMGDTGSLALGAALAVGAILTRSVFLLPFIGFIFFVEMFSVIFQVAYFKYTRKKFGEGKRIFRRAPLHHHFELGGWSEWRVVGAFWAVNALTTALGLILFNTGVIPRFP